MKECPHLTHLTCLGLIQRFYPPLPLEIRPHLKEVVIGGTELTAADLERYGPVLQYKYAIAFFSFSSLFGFYREGHVVLCYSITSVLSEKNLRLHVYTRSLLSTYCHSTSFADVKTCGDAI